MFFLADAIFGTGNLSSWSDAGEVRAYRTAMNDILRGTKVNRVPSILWAQGKAQGRHGTSEHRTIRQS